MNVFKRLIFPLLFLLLTLASGLAMAQQSTDLSQYFAATPQGDWSMRLWSSVLSGEFVSSPFAQIGAPTTLLGKLFVIFNGAIFAVGMAWLGYGILSGIVGTAQDGQALGQRINTAWYPIRVITGIGGMAPVLGGFTLGQGLLMSAAGLGIGIANMMWTAAVSDLQLTQLVSGSISGAPVVRTSQAEAVIDSMFRSNVCIIASKRQEKMTIEALKDLPYAPLEPEFFVSVRPVASTDGLTIKYGSANAPEICGSVSVALERARNADSATAFRVQSVDYAGIRNAVSVAAAEKLLAVDANIRPLAEAYMAAVDASTLNQLSMDMEPLGQAASAYVNDVQGIVNAALTDKSSSITAAAQAKMRETGWIGAGAWFSTFAEANAALADATSGLKLGFRAPQADLASEVNAEMNRVAGVLLRARQAKASTAVEGSGDAVETALADTCSDMPSLSGMMGTATGNCSLGQAIVSKIIGGTMRGSGGSGASGSVVFGTGTDQVGLVNILIGFKNAGDYLMVVASTLVGANFAGEKMAASVAWAGATAAKWAGAAGSVIGIPGAPALAAGGAAVQTGSSVAQTVATYAVPMGFMLLALSALLSIFLPMLPYVLWIGGLVSYAAAFLEALIASPLHSMAHLHSEGEGMGSGTSKGYLSLLSVLVRPALMVLAFFVASALMIGLGTLNTVLFMPAMASVQGNSISGLASIIVLLIVYFSLNVTLINSSFELISTLPDHVISYLGAGEVSQSLGKGTASKVDALFLAGSRGGNMATQASAVAGAEAKKNREKKS